MQFPNCCLKNHDYYYYLKNHDYKANFQACHQHAIAEFPAGKFMILKEEDGGGGKWRRSRWMRSRRRKTRIQEEEEKDGLVQCVTDRASVGIHISAA